MAALSRPFSSGTSLSQPEALTSTSGSLRDARQRYTSGLLTSHLWLQRSLLAMVLELGLDKSQAIQLWWIVLHIVSRRP